MQHSRNTYWKYQVQIITIIESLVKQAIISICIIQGVNPVKPRVDINPTYQQVREGEPVEFRCEATGNPQPQLDWIRAHGSMSPEATFYNGVWSLPAASKNDAAEYKCIARNNVGVDEKTTILYVQGTVKIGANAYIL